MRYSSLAFALLMGGALLLTGCSTVKAISILNKSEPADETFFAELPLYYEKGGLPIIDVVIEGEVLRFVVNTAIISSVIDSTVLARVQGKKVYNDRLKSTKRQVAKLDEIKIAGISFRDVGMGVVNFTPMRDSANACVPAFDGAIGANVLRDAAWQFDYDGGRLRFASEAARLPTPPGEARHVALDVSALGDPEVELLIETSLLVEVELNTGDRSGLRLPLATRHKVRQPELLRPAYYQPGNRLDTSYYYRPSRVLLGGVHPILEPELHFLNRSEGSIGNRFLSQYVFTIDYPGEDLWLYRRPDALPYDLTSCRCGFGFTHSGNQWRVHFLVSDTEAGRVLQLGDEIINLNGVNMVGLSPQAYCEIDWKATRPDADDLLVTIRRQGQELKFTLPKEGGITNE
jgi:hypothetical protein